MEVEGEGFVIKDRRKFSADTGEPVEEEPERPEKERAVKKEPPTGEAESTEEEYAQLPEVNFSTFIFSLSSSAFLHFGEIPDPASGKKKKNLPMAKHSIDILSMLEAKTKGNLTDDEKQLLENILYDLRMRYVKETK